MKPDPSIRIEACPGVYAPAEDSYLLLSAVKVRKDQQVLDMGCGTGIIALHCARAGCRVKAADISVDAVKNARMNAAINALDVDPIHSDLFAKVKGKFDVIIFNPPYLSSEDSDALSETEKEPLVGGERGHEVSVRFLERAPEHLEKSGKMYLLTSSESEAGVLEKAKAYFSIRKVAERRIFFELLSVWKLKSLK